MGRCVKKVPLEVRGHVDWKAISSSRPLIDNLPPLMPNNNFFITEEHSVSVLNESLLGGPWQCLNLHMQTVLVTVIAASNDYSPL